LFRKTGRVWRHLSGFSGGLPSSGEFGILSMARAKDVVAIAADFRRGRKSGRALLAAQPDGKTVQRFRVNHRKWEKTGNWLQKAQKIILCLL
jgi:hypothetical protein